METIKTLKTLVNETYRDCLIYKSPNGNEYFFVEGEPIDEKVLFHSETISGYVVIIEDNNGERMLWICEEA